MEYTYPGVLDDIVDCARIDIHARQSLERRVVTLDKGDKCGFIPVAYRGEEVRILANYRL